MSDWELIDRFLHDTFIALTQRLDAVDAALVRLREEMQKLHEHPPQRIPDRVCVEAVGEKAQGENLGPSFTG